MITPNDIMESMERMVRERFPEEEVYTNLQPANFKRPSTLIQMVRCRSRVGYGCQIIEMRPTFMLSTYVPVDPYHHGHVQTIHLRQMILLGMFLPGYIDVGDRKVKLAMDQAEDWTELGGELGGDNDYGTVTVPMVYTLDRGEFENIPQPPMMEELHVRQEVVTYG